ncbi:hypothetical protein ABPG75_010728 [Micractinium tetrahymenae]
MWLCLLQHVRNGGGTAAATPLPPASSCAVPCHARLLLPLMDVFAPMGSVRTRGELLQLKPIHMVSVPPWASTQPSPSWPSPLITLCYVLARTPEKLLSPWEAGMCRIGW